MKISPYTAESTVCLDVFGRGLMRVLGVGKHIAVATVENNGEMETCSFAIADDLPVGAVKVEISKNGLIGRTMVFLISCVPLS